MTPEEITKLAEEYTKTWIKVDNLPGVLGHVVLRGMAKEMEELIRFILRTHCIVEKSDGKESEEATIDGWVARNKYGDIYIYGNKPKRCLSYWYGSLYLELPYTSFPSLTWESDPVEVTITIKPKKK